jgi:hypothetical protein
MNTTILGRAVDSQAVELAVAANEPAADSFPSRAAGRVERGGNGGGAAAARRQPSAWWRVHPSPRSDLLAFTSFTTVQALLVYRQWADKRVVPVWPSVLLLGSALVLALCAARPALWWRHRWAAGFT